MSYLLMSLVVASSLIAITAAIVILLRNYRLATYRWLAGFLIFASLWSLIVNLQNPALSLVFNLWIVRVTFIAAILMAYTLFRFVVAVAAIKLPRGAHGIVAVAAIGVTGLMVSDLVIPFVEVVNGRVVPERQMLYYVVIGYILFLCVYGLFLLWRVRTQSKAQRRAQLTTIFIGLVAGIVLGIFTNIILPNVLGSITPSRFAWIATSLWTILLVYAVIRQQFLDIRLAAVRTATYVLSLITLAAAYYLLVFILSQLFLQDKVLVQPIGIVLALLLAFVFQPIKRFFDRLTNRLFYKDNYDVDDFFAQLNRTLTSTTHLRGLLERASHVIQETFKAEQVYFVIQNSKTNRSTTIGTKQHIKLPASEVASIQEVYGISSSIIIASLLAENDPIHRLMMSHRLELIIPLVQNDILLGYLCLGEHRTAHYSVRDLKVLATTTDELIIAIQNALAVQEVTELNDTLQQRVAAATKELRASNSQLQRLDEAKDEFISMASHQLRTPLTSVKGYISMIMEGDAGKISDTQRHLLSEAFVSSERMVHLINDFLNVSRLQTGKFMIEKRPIDLAKVVGQELDSLATNAAARTLKFSYRAPKNLPALNVDESKIRQVIMNFADNAIYYSKEHTTIKVTLKIDGKDILFTVKDTGIGVPTAEQGRLFNKFFRATNARKQRPDGTGVGLFLAKKVIDAHDGQVVFESKEGKGSMFGFRLPLRLTVVKDSDKLDNQPNDNNHDAAGN